MSLGSLQAQTSHDGSSPSLCDTRSPQLETRLAKCFCQIVGLVLCSSPQDNLERTLKGGKDPKILGIKSGAWHKLLGHSSRCSRSLLKTL